MLFHFSEILYIFPISFRKLHFLEVRIGATKDIYITIVNHNIFIIIVPLCRCDPSTCKYVFHMEGIKKVPKTLRRDGNG